jgi:hypothetical protein
MKNTNELDLIDLTIYEQVTNSGGYLLRPIGLGRYNYTIGSWAFEAHHQFSDFCEGFALEFSELTKYIKK